MGTDLVQAFNELSHLKQEVGSEASAIDVDIGRPGGFQAIHATFKHLCSQLQQ